MSDPQPLLSRLANDYPLVAIKEGNFVAISPMLHTVAILSECNEYGYHDRWCYNSWWEAIQALGKWSGLKGTEPYGWHRCVRTGRRRPDGDWKREYINH